MVLENKSIYIYEYIGFQYKANNKYYLYIK